MRTMLVKTRSQWRSVIVALTLALVPALDGPASAQTTALRTNGKILYHNGPVMTATSNVYYIWYGCWHDGCGISGDSATITILTDFITSLGGSPYNRINAGYPNASGVAPTGGLIYGGSSDDMYSHGNELTQSDIEGIVANQINYGSLPVDPRGIYIVLASADVSSNDTGFCSTNCQCHHSMTIEGTGIKYAFVGNGVRCPTTCASQFIAPGGSWLPTPNGSLAADTMASSIAHAISGTLTNPTGLGWYDRYGFENSDKCEGTYGQAYITANGARANMRLGARDYLIQQNWVSGRRGHCGLQP